MVSLFHADCYGISPLGYWKKVNQWPTQTKSNNIPPLELRDIEVQAGYTGQRVTSTRFQFLGTQGEYFLWVQHGEVKLFFKKTHHGG